MVFFLYTKSKFNLQERTHFCKNALLQQLGLFVNLRSGAEGGQRQPALLRRRCAGDHSGFPPLAGAVIVLRERPGRSAEPHAPSLCRRDALRLPLADVGALVLRHEGQYLQDNVAEKGPHQVLAPAGVQQRHIQHHNVDFLFLSKNPPLFQNLAVVASQPVDALDVEQIVRLEFSDQLFVLGTVKVLAGLLVHEDILLRDGHFPQSNQLPVLVLLPGADPDIAVCIF